METVNRTPEFLEASAKLLPILKAIPKEAIVRHHLNFQTIIEEMMEEEEELGKDMDPADNRTIEDILAQNIPYYLNYGMSQNKFLKLK